MVGRLEEEVGLMREGGGESGGGGKEGLKTEGGLEPSAWWGRTKG